MTKRAITPAKITRPVISGVYQRRRLFKQMDSFKKQSVIWLSGLAGAGKTTLVGSYLTARKLPCLWYTVDEGDEDLASFFYYIGLAAKKASPRKKKPMPILTPEYLMGIPTFTRNFFEELGGRLKPRSVLVFDNYQKLSQDSALHNVLLEGISRLPKTVKVIIVSRTDPPPAFSNLKATGGMSVITWDDLRLTIDESKGIAKNLGFKRLSKKDGKELHRTTHGWTAGLLLMLEELKSGKVMPGSFDAETPEALFDYFAEEIFKKTEKRKKDFLMRSAFLPIMTSHMTEQLTENRNARRVLSDLRKRNYFIDKRSDPKTVYQYHPLFREFLLSMAEQSYTKNRITGFRKKAGTLLEESNYTEDAASLYVEAGQWEPLSRLVNTEAKDLLAKGMYKTLEGWIRKIPPTVIEKDPWLLYWLGASVLALNPPGSKEYFEKSFNHFWKRKEPAGVFLAYCGILNSFSFFPNRLALADRWITYFKKVQKRFPSYPSKEIEDQVTLSIFNLLALSKTDHPDYKKWLKKIDVIRQESMDANLKALASFSIGFHCYYMGDIAKLKSVHHSVSLMMKQKNVSPQVQCVLNFMLAANAAYFTLDEGEDNLKVISNTLKTTKSLGIHIWDLNLKGHAAYYSLATGRLDITKKIIEEARPFVTQANSIDTLYLLMISTYYYLQIGDLHSAETYVDMILKNSEEVGAYFAMALANITVAVVMHELGERRRSVTHLRKVHDLAKRMKSPHMEFLYLLVKTKISFDKGEDRKALALLKKCMAHGKKSGIEYFIQIKSSDKARLFAKALENNIEVDYVKNLIRKQNIVPESPPLDIENWPWPLKIYTLGRFGIIKNDKPVSFARKAPKKPLEMLNAIIAMGAREVSVEQLTDVMWPDTHGDAANVAFDTTIKRLRNLLGDENSLHVNDGRVSINSRVCWVDTLAFQRVISQIDSTEKGDGRLELFEKAVDLYKGHFLDAHKAEPWSISLRERLKNRFIKCISELGQLYEEMEDCEGAIDCYQKGLNTDDLTEDFYLRLMKCYQSNGRRADAMVVYRRCKKTFSAVLGIEPSPEIRSLYKTLKGS